MKYDLIKCIITDENMEYFNGSDAIKFIRKLEKVKKFKATQILSLTCHEEKDIVNFIFGSGANMVISKPLSKILIKNKLMEILNF